MGWFENAVGGDMVCPKFDELFCRATYEALATPDPRTDC